MRRPLVFVTIGIILGIMGELYLKSIALFFMLFIFVIIRIIKEDKVKVFIIFLIGFLLGYSLVFLKEGELVKVFEGNTKVTIISNVKTSDYKDEYLAKVEGKSTYLLLKVDKKVEDLNYGDLVEIKGELKKTSKQRNYGGYDYSKYLYSSNISGTIKVSNIRLLKENNLNKYKIGINKTKLNIKKKIKQLLSNESAELFSSLMLADKSNLSQEIQEDFRDSNLSHVLAVSGMHVAYITTTSMLIFNVLINKRWTKGLIILVLIVYMELTGYIPSVVRASVMLIIGLFGEMLFLQKDVYNNFSLAIIVILISNPYTVFNLGFQLSCLGTLGILLYQEKILECINDLIDRVYNTFNIKIENRTLKNYAKKEVKYSFIRKLLYNLKKKILKSIKECLAVTLAANILIMPISIINFNNIPINFLLSSLLATPIISFVLTLGIITVLIAFLSIKLANIPAHILELAIKILILITKFSGKISNVKIITPSIISVFFYYVFIIFYSYRKKSPKLLKKTYSKKTVIIIIVIVIITNCNFDFGLDIHMVDVGQGDCTFIEVEGKRLLIDGGGSEFSDYDVGEKVVVPYLLDRKTKKLDYVMISHFDSDHVGGIFSVLQDICVENIIICEQQKMTDNYIKFVNIAKRKRVNIIVVKMGDRIKVSKQCYIDIIWPNDENKIKENWINNNSIVARLCYKNFSLLFCGDIEEIAEKEILNKYANSLKSTVLKVAHHGSKTSSIDSFLNKVSPKIAIIGVGEGNNFGHPNSNVIERLTRLNCKVYRTDRDGEISIKVRNNSIRLTKKVNIK